MKGAEPALDVGGVPARHQAAVLEGAQFQGCVGPSSDHLMESVLQGYRVIMGSLVLQTSRERVNVSHGGTKGRGFCGAVTRRFLDFLLFIIGDWNAKVGRQETPGETGKFGLGVQNEALQRLTEFSKRMHWS